MINRRRKEEIDESLNNWENDTCERIIGIPEDQFAIPSFVLPLLPPAG